jgi:hypothetical protein
VATLITGSGVDNIIDGTITNADINASAAIAGSKLDGSFGVTDISKWGVAAYNGNSTDPVTGWTEETRIIGSAMTHSGGTFSFPSTGIWEISLTVTFYKSDNSALNAENVTGAIQSSTDGGSTWGEFATGQSHFDSPGNDWWRTQVTATGVLDVTNTSTHKIKARTYVYGSTQLYISISSGAGGIWFKKLGDT